MKIDDIDRAELKRIRARARVRRRGTAPRLLRSGAGVVLLAVVCAAAFRLGAAIAADRQSGIQTAPVDENGDPTVGEYVLVSKDINGDRWAITVDISNDSIIGNVFPQAGGAPQFVACSLTDSTDTQYSFHCFVANACTGSTCDGTGWTDLGTVPLDKSFITAPGQDPPF